MRPKSSSPSWVFTRAQTRFTLTVPEPHVVEELTAHADVAVRLEQVDALLERLHRLAVLHARLRVLLDPRGLLLHLVLRLLQLAADFLHHLSPELLLIECARGLPGARSRGGRRRSGGRARACCRRIGLRGSG